MWMQIFSMSLFLNLAFGKSQGKKLARDFYGPKKRKRNGGEKCPLGGWGGVFGGEKEGGGGGGGGEGGGAVGEQRRIPNR